MKIKRKICIPKKTLQLFIMLFVFFPPMLLNHLISTSSFWRLVNYGYKLAQLAFGSISILFWCLNRRREHSAWFGLLMAHMCGMLLVCLPNGSMTFDVFQRRFCELSFCFLCAENFKNHRKDFIRAGLGVFALYTLWGVLSIYLFPRGFYNASNTYGAWYGLGAKNNSFPFYFAFFFFLYLHSVEKDGRIHKLSPILVILAIIAGLICESINTVLCLAFVLVLYFMFTYFKPILVRMNPKVVFIAFVTIIAAVYIGTQLPIVENFLALFNRSATFSGRNTLWKQAFGYIHDHPFFGEGYHASYQLLGGVVTSHAHSQWLDKMAKYGLLQQIPLYILLYTTFAKGNKYRYRAKGNMLAILLLIYMVHMSFDTYNYNFFTMFLVVANGMLRQTNLAQDHWLMRKAELRPKYY